MDHDDLEVDIYNSRSLPYVIGTEAWLESEDAGLGMGLEDDEGSEGGEDDDEEVRVYAAMITCHRNATASSCNISPLHSAIIRTCQNGEPQASSAVETIPFRPRLL